MTVWQAGLLFLAILGVALIGIGWFIYSVEAIEDKKRTERRDW